MNTYKFSTRAIHAGQEPDPATGAIMTPIYGIAESKKFLENTKLFSLAESLEGVESLIEHPAIMTHASVPAGQRKKLGIHDNLIRISVGIEDIEDLTEDLSNALRKV